VGEMNKLIDGLKYEHFTDGEIEKIMYKNTLRLIKDVMK
jgi:microsomal dipeptidase-like Zn-dependent dipeptidase